MSGIVERYREEAVRFVPRGGTPLRVAPKLVTCGLAARLLDELRVPPESAMAYRYVNVHNPDCPLQYDVRRCGWHCADALAAHPAWGINWAGARLLCQALGARLPSALEWECFAADNDVSRTYPWGEDAPTPRLANFDEHYGGTTPVGQFPPSDLGLFDLAGNVGEWCLNAYAEGTPLERVVKGGAWSKSAVHLRIAARRGKWARLGTTTIGLRPVWDDR
jgi:formylglycine-generating enzyme required for sulfatase activity